MTTQTQAPRGLTAAYLKSKHDAGLSWEKYLATDPQRAGSWKTVYENTKLTDGQKRLVQGFNRQIRALCVTGIWCGDCAQQVPLIQRIAEGNPDRIDLRYVDRDEHMDLAAQIKINGGLRVPVMIFMAEDYEPCSIFGDRTLTRYRALAAAQLVGACPLPGAPVPDDERNATLQEWLNEIERVHLLLRLSGRLREKHGD